MKVIATKKDCVSIGKYDIHECEILYNGLFINGVSLINNITNTISYLFGESMIDMNKVSENLLDEILN